MRTVLTCLFVIAACSTASAQEKVTTYLDCVHKADFEYQAKWKEQCHLRPEVKTRDEAKCDLPLFIGSSLNNNLKMARDLCSQAHAAGVLK
jgi:hypothetical protein